MDDIRIPCIVWLPGDPPPDLSGISQPIRISFVLRRQAADHRDQEHGPTPDINPAHRGAFPQYRDITDTSHERVTKPVDARKPYGDDEARGRRNTTRRQTDRSPFDWAMAIARATGGTLSEQPHATPSGFTYGKKYRDR